MKQIRTVTYSSFDSENIPSVVTVLFVDGSHLTSPVAEAGETEIFDPSQGPASICVTSFKAGKDL